MKVSDELILEFSNILCNYRFIIVQHLLKDTYEFVETLLKCGVEISCLLFKEYSSKYSLNESLQQLNTLVLKAELVEQMRSFIHKLAPALNFQTYLTRLL